MEYQNLLKNMIDISLYYKSIDEKIFTDNKFIDLLELISNKQQYKKIQYAFYTDLFLLRKNIFIPNFHTIYLSNNQHNVILDDIKDTWLVDIFPNNKYYLLNGPNSINIYDSRINIISSIKDLVRS